MDAAALIAKAHALFAWGGMTHGDAEALVSAALSLGEGASMADVWACAPSEAKGE